MKKALKILLEVRESIIYAKSTSPIYSRQSEFFDAGYRIEIEKKLKELDEAIAELEELKLKKINAE